MMSIESMSSKSLGLVDEDGKLLVDGKDDTNADKLLLIPIPLRLSRRYPPSVPHLVLFRTVWSTPSTTWTM